MSSSHKLLSALLVAFFCLARPAFSAEKDPLFWVFDSQVLGGYSEIEGRDGVGTVLADWLVSPTLKLDERAYWINVYNGSYNRSAQVVAVEEGGRQSETTQDHDLSTALKYKVTDTWSLRPLFFAHWTFVNETEDEDFGDGLYDYRDIGGGIESSWITLETEERRDEVKLGFRYLAREYPNYRSLLSLVTVNPVETDEKDLDGYKINLSRDSMSKNGWSWGLEGILFYKDYTDKKTINTNGILSPDDTREDLHGYVNAFVSRPVCAGWTFRLDGQFGANDSNLDFYDTHNTVTLADDDFIAGYFDWYSVTVTPALLYSRNLAEGRDLKASVSYTYYLLHYPGRQYQNEAGRYQASDQEDNAHTVAGKISYPVTPNVSWVTFLSYTTVDSNQEFERFYLYTYDRWVAATGIAVKF